MKYFKPIKSSLSLFISFFVFFAYIMSFNSAQAADITKDETDVTPLDMSNYSQPYSWSGFYLGVQLGEHSTQQKYSVNDIDFSSLAPDYSSTNYGLYSGYNYQFRNNLVLGIETDIMSANSSAIAPIFDEKLNGSARLRVGYAFDRFMPFISGGFSYALAKHDSDDDINFHFDSLSDDVVNQVANSIINNGGVVPSNIQSEIRETIRESIKNSLNGPSGNQTIGGIAGYEAMYGFSLGAGFGYAFTDHLLFQLEYRYNDYRSATGDLDLSSVTDGLYTTKYSYKYNTNDLRLGLAYKF